MKTIYENVANICENNEFFKMKHQIFGSTTVAQCNYHLASAGDFFPDIIELEENEHTISIYGEIKVNGKKLKNMNDVEIQNIGFEFLSTLAFNN